MAVGVTIIVRREAIVHRKMQTEPGTASGGEWAAGYTKGMKTAVSLPDVVFRAAEQLARRAHKSRSQLYADALTEYLARHAPDEVTKAMNGVVDRLGAIQPDAFGKRAARAVFERAEW